MQVEIPDGELQTIISGLGSALEAMVADSVERDALRTLLRRLTLGRTQDRGSGVGDVRGPAGPAVDPRVEPIRLDDGRGASGVSDDLAVDVPAANEPGAGGRGNVGR